MSSISLRGRQDGIYYSIGQAGKSRYRWKVRDTDLEGIDGHADRPPIDGQSLPCPEKIQLLLGCLF